MPCSFIQPVRVLDTKQDFHISWMLGHRDLSSVQIPERYNLMEFSQIKWHM